MKRYRLAATVAVALLFLLTLGISRASADTINTETFLFTSDHCTGGCGTSPFGSVVLTQKGTSVEIVVTLFNGNEFVKTAAGDNQAFKFNATGVVLGDITINSPTNPVLTADFCAGGCFNGDGTGNFSFGIFCAACGPGGSDAFPGPIDFTVANAMISDFTTQNNKGQVFVADIISGQTGNTGPVDASTGVVPDGGMTVMLLGGALVGLATLRRRF
jgi:hypothetical protein